MNEESSRRGTESGSSTESGDSHRSPRGSRAVRWLPRLLAESVLIVLSVLLALAVNEWRDERERAARAEMALASIEAELRENAEAVERARTRHRVKMDTLSAYAASGRLPPPEVYLYGMFSPGALHSTAWESAREAGVTSDIPYDLVLTLSRVYDAQNRYRALAAAMTEDIMRDVRREGMEIVMRDRFRSFIPLQLDFANREASLSEDYEAVLGVLAERAEDS